MNVIQAIRTDGDFIEIKKDNVHIAYLNIHKFKRMFGFLLYKNSSEDITFEVFSREKRKTK